MEAILLALWLAAGEYGVSYELLYAVAKVESSLYPYAVHVDGRSYYPETKEQALSLIKGKKNYDLGLMQINSYWVRKYNVPPERLLDVYYNARFGAAILRYCFDLFGSTWKAVDCYHRGEKRAREYSLYTKKICSIVYNIDEC